MILRLPPVVDLGADHGEELLARPQRTRLTGTKRGEDVRNAEGGGVRIDEGCSRVEEGVMGDIQWLLLRPCSSHHISYTVTARQERGKKITRLLIPLTPLAAQSDRHTDRQTDRHRSHLQHCRGRYDAVPGGDPHHGVHHDILLHEYVSLGHTGTSCTISRQKIR